MEVNVGNNGVITESEEEIDVAASSQKIKDVKDGMGDLNLVGKVLEVSEIRTFQRKDGSSGKVGSLLLGDATGTIRVTLWDEKTEFLNQIEYGDTVELVNAYARENAFSQKVELQVGSRSIIRKSEKKIEYEEKFTPIADISADMNDINVSGRVLDIGETRTFNQQVELNLGSRGIIQKSEKEIEYREKFTDIADIVPGESYSVQGKVYEIGELREFEREDGTENVVANLQLKDETGSIRLTLWGEQAYVIEDLDIDSEIQVINAYAKYGLNEEIELSVGNRSRVIIL